MADNYLEKRMEDYRKGDLAKSRNIPASAKRRNDCVAGLRLAYATALVAISDHDIREAVVRQFAASGCRTAFICDDTRIGSSLAQSSGAMFCPAVDMSQDSVSRMAAVARGRWSELALLITDDYALALDGAHIIYIGQNHSWQHGDAVALSSDVIFVTSADRPSDIALATALVACRSASEVLKILRR